MSDPVALEVTKKWRQSMQVSTRNGTEHLKVEITASYSGDGLQKEWDLRIFQTGRPDDLMMLHIGKADAGVLALMLRNMADFIIDKDKQGLAG